MGAGISPEELEQIRRSLAMSPSRMASGLLIEVQRLRRQLTAVMRDLETAEQALAEARSKLS